MSIVSKKFGRKLKAMRIDRGISQFVLSQDAGLDLTTVNELENGHRDPMLSTVKKLAKALKVSIDTLIS